MSSRRGDIFSGNYSFGPELRAELEEYLQPIYKDGEMLLEVECGENRGLMYVSRLCQGSKGPCVYFQETWLTPNEFQYISGRETAKDWKRSIRHKGRSIKLLLTKGILSVHPSTCDCEGCRISSPVHKTRLTKKKSPEFSDYGRMRIGIDGVPLERAPYSASFSLAELWKQREKQLESLRESRLTSIINQLRKSKEEIQHFQEEGYQTSIKGSADNVVSDVDKARMLENSSAPGHLEPSRDRADKSSEENTDSQRPQSAPNCVMLESAARSQDQSPSKVDSSLPNERPESGLVMLANEAHARAMETGNCSNLIRQLAAQHSKFQSSQKQTPDHMAMMEGETIPRLPQCPEIGRYPTHGFYPPPPPLLQAVYQPPVRNGLHSQGRLLELRRPLTTLHTYDTLKRPAPRDEDAPVDLSVKRNRLTSSQERLSAFDTVYVGSHGLQTNCMPNIKSERHVDLNDNISSTPRGRELLRDYLHESPQCPKMTADQKSMVQQMRYWSADDVVNFIKTFPDCADYVETFREQRIDGQSLRLLSVDLLTSSLGMKLGPALNLRAFIAKLCGQCDQCRHCLHCHQNDSEN
ncbi:uncharacterized protein LOC106178465 [Lingula anatina]|uniref:Uncharacterized protein LOC106178465 n=1 Tax=Lingula anatina TaxID=7574 RepID=A0A1S3K410_LINAN|nr:uncharacterized protein LOC106178465 [Lingula anatina]|eukprot:XP_013417149.1 uncharacterized protein LOC106178465 [Lingula anatina]